jgi:hypothetical protein
MAFRTKECGAGADGAVEQADKTCQLRLQMHVKGEDRSALLNHGHGF